MGLFILIQISFEGPELDCYSSPGTLFPSFLRYYNQTDDGRELWTLTHLVHYSIDDAQVHKFYKEDIKTYYHSYVNVYNWLRIFFLCFTAWHALTFLINVFLTL